LCLTKLISAPTAISANPNPIIKSSNGEKLVICELALLIKSVTKFVGNSIICDGAEGRAPRHIIQVPLFCGFDYEITNQVSYSEC